MKLGASSCFKSSDDLYVVRRMLRILASLMILSVIASAEPAGDQGLIIQGEQQFKAMLKAAAPYTAKARATYPGAKKRYLDGLPKGYIFAVRKHLTEPGTQHMEGAFIGVDSIKDGKIYGRIAQDVQLPSFRRGQRISLPESELEDWAIFHPDGTEEGNFVGNFLKNARSAYTNDLALTSNDVAKLKQVCGQAIGVPFQGAALWRWVQPFIGGGSDFYQPTIICRDRYCSGGLRLRDATEVLFTYLHIDRNSTDLTPDVGVKGNNRIVGISLVRHGKTILSKGHLDQNGVDLYLRERNSKKKSK